MGKVNGPSFHGLVYVRALHMDFGAFENVLTPDHIGHEFFVKTLHSVLECLHEELLLGRQQLLELNVEGLIIAKLYIARVLHLAAGGKWAGNECFGVGVLRAIEVEAETCIYLRSTHGQRHANSVPSNHKSGVGEAATQTIGVGHQLGHGQDSFDPVNGNGAPVYSRHARWAAVFPYKIRHGKLRATVVYRN